MRRGASPNRPAYPPAAGLVCGVTQQCGMHAKAANAQSNKQAHLRAARLVCWVVKRGQPGMRQRLLRRQPLGCRMRGETGG